MRLFHVSEDPDISVFEPRLPRRDDLDKNTGLVWAVEESYLPLLLMPRDCPRVVYRAGKGTSQGDRDRYCLFAGCSFVVAVEEKWVARMHNTVLYLYEFDPAGFAIQDEVAGYYTARTPQIPIAKRQIEDAFAALLERNVKIRIMENLWDLADAVQQSTLDWLVGRMRFAQPRPPK